MIDFIKNLPPWVYIAIIAHLTILGTVAYLILLERKIASWVQDRIGPNRVGPFGLFQPLADGLKFILKEDYRPKDVDKILFTVAPGVMILVVIISIAVIPWGGVHRATRMTELRQDESPQHAARRVMPSNATMVGEPQVITAMAERTDYGYEVAAPRPQVSVTYDYPFQIASLNIGVLFILAVLSLAVYGIVIGGWASNNKYSFLGGLRAAAQMISYEIPLGLSVLCIIVMYGTLDLGELVDKQAHYWIGFIPAWNVFSQPLAFLMFLVCIHAEANRAPFDLAEAEQELVGGYHTEYSAMRFALFFLAEYAGMITTSAVCVALFFGGWHFPGLTGNVDPSHPAITTSLGMCLLRCLVFFVKVIAIIFIFMWVRWSLPRFRFDQLMMLAWRALIPISLALLTFTALAVYFFGANPARAPLMLVDGKFALALLIGNIILLAVIMFVSTLLPAPPLTNRRVRILNSRFDRTPLPAIP